MKPENKISILTRLSDEMKAVVNFQQPSFPTGLLMATLRPNVSITLLSVVSRMPTRRPYALWRHNNPNLLVSTDQSGYLILSARRRTHSRQSGYVLYQLYRYQH